MSELTEMLNRCELNNLISFIIYGAKQNETEINIIEQNAIEISFDRLFDNLEKIFPTANRDNEELFSAVNEFSTTLQNSYLKMGVLVGLQLQKSLNTELILSNKTKNIQE